MPQQPGLVSTAFGAMAYLDANAREAIRQDPSRVVAFFHAHVDDFARDLGMGGLSAEALKAAWCSIVAHKLVPYGPGPQTTALRAILDADAIACAHYITLTWHLLAEFGLERDNLVAIGWDGGAVGNHAQLLFDDGASRLLLDPTVGRIANGVTLHGLIAGERYDAQASFLDRMDIAAFDRIVGQALAGGSHHVRDLIYHRPTFEHWLTFDSFGHVIEAEGAPRQIVGGLYADALTAGDGGDEIYAGGGDDTILGGAGADTIEGGSGNDVFHVQGTADRIAEFADHGFDSVWSTGNFILPDHVEQLLVTQGMYATGNAAANLVYGHAGENVVSGLSGDDRLYGLGGADLLTGGDGDDTLWGGAAADTLYGLAGADIFYFAGTEEIGPGSLEADLIVDFDAASGDLIFLSPIDADEVAPGDQSFAFIGVAPFTAPGQLAWFTTWTETRIILNTDDDPDFEGLIRIAGLTVPEAAWFVL